MAELKTRVDELETKLNDTIAASMNATHETTTQKDTPAAAATDDGKGEGTDGGGTTEKAPVVDDDASKNATVTGGGTDAKGVPDDNAKSKADGRR